METKTLTIENRGPVQWVTLNRPEQLNAITGDMAEELAAYFEGLIRNTSVRVVVLRGAGRGFCAGLDMKARLAGEGSPEKTARLPDIIKAMRTCPQPIIALVHGPACGGGFAFALASDIRLAGQSARMNDAFIKIGLSGCELGLSYFLPRQVGASVAAELMYTGRFISAERALRTGLVSEVVADEDLEDAAQDIIGEMLQASPMGLRKTKETLTRCLNIDDVHAVIDIEQAVQTECMRSPNMQEAIKAFVEKRQPNFVDG